MRKRIVKRINKKVDSLLLEWLKTLVSVLEKGGSFLASGSASASAAASGFFSESILTSYRKTTASCLMGILGTMVVYYARLE